MTLKKTKKRSKFSRMRGRKMGTHGGGARKKRKKSGHRGGIGMSGSGKRSDQIKTLVLKLYGHGYFGKQGITSRKTERDTRKRINIQDINFNLDAYLKKGLGKKTSKGFELDLKNYKILGKGNINEKIFVKAKEASKSAIEKVREKGGDIILPKKLDEKKLPEEKPKKADENKKE